jgi:hypothetical protein
MMQKFSELAARWRRWFGARPAGEPALMSGPSRLKGSDKLPLLSIDPVTKAAMERIVRDGQCGCLEAHTRKGPPKVPKLHVDDQVTDVPGWLELVDLVRASAVKRAHVLEPSARIDGEDWMEVITLPAGIEDLQAVRELRLYGSHLRRLPPQIGRMSALENLDVYTSYSLHWLPYEVLRCQRLASSRMSTRALYGNRNTRLPFPRLAKPVEALIPGTCSVCDRAFGETGPEVFWMTLRVGTDIVPLLVHSCSRDCTLSIPKPPKHYFERPHKGGRGVGMPDVWDPSRGKFWSTDVFLEI